MIDLEIGKQIASFPTSTDKVKDVQDDGVVPSFPATCKDMKMIIIEAILRLWVY